MGRDSVLIDEAIAGNATALAELEKRVGGELDNHDETLLHKESGKGNLEHVLFILRAYPHKNLLVKLSERKHTALHVATQKNHTRVVEALINEAKKLFSSSSSSSTSTSANPPVTPFQHFLRLADEDEDTALHAAVYAGNYEIVKLLVEADPSDQHIKNTDGKTPIYLAAAEGYNKIVKVICRTCPHASLDGPGSSTALHPAIENFHKEDGDVIRMLIDAAKRSSSPNRSLEAFFNGTDKNNLTVLDLAVEGNHLDVVRQILREDPAYGRGIKKNALMHLIYRAIDCKESAGIVKLLSKAYEAGITGVHKGVVNLILAIKRRDDDEIRRMLTDTPNLVNFAEDEGWTPLHYVAYQGLVSILEVFIEVQKKVNHSFLYQDKVTPFHVAAEYGHTNTLRRLMQLWPSSSSAYTAIDKNGRNILHIAAAENKKEMIQDILKYCPEKDKDKILKEKDANENTLLHLLISHGCFISELLKHEGFDTGAINKDKWTPHDMLYWKSDIIADQVQIKIALDDDVLVESKVVTPIQRDAKNVIFSEKTKLLMAEEHAQMDIQKKNDLMRYKNRTNTQIIVSALITIVAFTVGFTMPGGVRQSGEIDTSYKKNVEGLAILSEKTFFKAFMILDTLALLFSTSSLFFYFLESMSEDLHQVSKFNVASTVFNIVSVMAMMLTFITGTHVVLSDSPTLAVTVSVIGSLFFLLLFFMLINLVYDHRVKRNKD